MTRTDDLYSLPVDLPAPIDDRACDHLVGTHVPAIALRSTRGKMIDLAGLTGRTVVYLYPRTGQPDQEPLAGWNAIPGARGCTPQSCAFRDHAAELEGHNVRLFGLSTQSTAYQREAVARLHLPFELLSDAQFAWIDALRLPTFELDATRFVKRITLLLRDGTIEHVWYPVFPPDRNADDVLRWLVEHPRH